LYQWTYKEIHDRSQKLSEFQKHVWDHLVKDGLHKISYLPDPKDKSKVQSTINFHDCFKGDIEKSLLVSKEIKKSFDSWHSIGSETSAPQLCTDQTNISNCLKSQGQNSQQNLLHKSQIIVLLPQGSSLNMNSNLE
jgi:hypothetical protein